MSSADQKGTEAVRNPLLQQWRDRLQKLAGPLANKLRVDSLLAEAEPFIEASSRAVREGASEDSVSWREARSLLWLLGYRLGDQSCQAQLVSGVLPAWRDELSQPNKNADELQGLLFDGFARGLEDRVRLEGQRALVAALPVVEVRRGMILVFAAGSLDPDGAHALVERASATLLRKDATAAVLDIAQLQAPSAAVLAELWSLCSSARLLGVKMAVSGMQGAVGELVKSAGLHDEGELRVETLLEAVALLEKQEEPKTKAGGSLGGWFRGLFGR